MYKEINDILIEANDNRDSLIIEENIKNYMTTEEGEKIKADIELLIDMGYNKKMINKVYILLQPENIERAIDYMTEIDGVFQHDFFENHNPKKYKGFCFICNRPKKYHLDYIPEDLLSQNNNNFQNDFIQNNNNDDPSNFNDVNVLKNEDKDVMSNECAVCFEAVEEEEKKSNSLQCGHVCCTQCWLNYLKTLIAEAKVEKIKCVDHDCKEIISEEFILKHINADEQLINKYKKFKKRAEIINDKNKRQCPNPDCESFLLKSSKTNYVKCENGHEYCFECLKPPHGNKKCDEIMEKEFIKWKKKRRVKRCPKCNIYTEKNEGCNHMTCVSCKYQWCWLCEGEYTYNHYSTGKCEGFQYVRADNIKEAKGRECCISLHTFFPCFYKKAHPVDLEYLWARYICIFAFWIFGYFLFAGFSMGEYTDKNLKLHDSIETIYYAMGFLIALCLFVCFQILYFCLITPFILICFIFPYFFDNILMFLSIGE